MLLSFDHLKDSDTPQLQFSHPPCLCMRKVQDQVFKQLHENRFFFSSRAFLNVTIVNGNREHICKSRAKQYQIARGSGIFPTPADFLPSLGVFPCRCASVLYFSVFYKICRLLMFFSQGNVDPCLNTPRSTDSGLAFYLYFPAYAEVVCKLPSTHQPPLGMFTPKTNCWLHTGITGGRKDGLCYE